MISKTLRHAAIAAAVTLALPAAASAEVIDFGSDLTAPANVAEAHGADTAFWGLSVEGVPFRVFSNVRGSTTAQFTRDNGTNIGATFTGAPKAGQELLMQMTLTTGYDASTVCGGMKGQEFKGVQIAPQSTKVRKRIARVRATCPGTSRQSCDGTVTLTIGPTVIGQASFSIPSTATTNVKIPVTKQADKLVLKKRK